MAIYYINENLESDFTAGSKAPLDIVQICKDLSYQDLTFPLIKSKNVNMHRVEVMMKYKSFWKRLVNDLDSSDIIIYQMPSSGKPLAQKYLPVLSQNHVKIITLIHDLSLLRDGIHVEGNDSVHKYEKTILESSAVIIAHNHAMAVYLISIGIDSKKIVELEIFDYLNGTKKEAPTENAPSIAIAGNLSPDKSKYIYKLGSQENKDLKIHLFGINYEMQDNPNYIYHGSFAPEELGKNLVGNFGLVWDGEEISTCSGVLGEYLKYNNPHKLSLYISSGMPVIVWKQSAEADFVTQHHIGIAVETLEHLDEQLKAVTKNDYQDMLKNIEELSQKLNEGYFTKKAIKTAITKCK